MSIKQPEIVSFDSGAAGAVLVIAGAVHGNEKCGTEAIRRVLGHIESGEVKITAGKVIFIPICNPRAYEQDVRFTDRNLNRMMFPKEAPEAYEDHLDNILCPVLEQADVLLDLHSCHCQSAPFVFLGSEHNRAELAFARALGVANFMHGWDESFANAEEDLDPRAGQGTNEYTRLHGGIAVTLECGSHQDPQAPKVGYQAILGALRYVGAAEIDPTLITAKQDGLSGHCVRLCKLYHKQAAGSFSRGWRNMDPVKEGEVLARYDNGGEICAPQDGFVILPKDFAGEDAPAGEEWFSFGVKSDLMVRNG